MAFWHTEVKRRFMEEDAAKKKQRVDGSVTGKESKQGISLKKDEPKPNTEESLSYPKR